MTSLAAYFDESGTHGGSQALAVAGYVSTPDRWELFEADWKTVLERYGIACFHMADFTNGAPPFDAWDQVRRDACFDDFVEITNRYALASVAAVVPMEAYHKILSAKAKRVCGGAYGLAASAIFMSLAQIVRANAQDGWIAYVFDRGAKGAGSVLATFQYNSRIKEQREKLRLLSLRFESKEEFFPLQAADILAYEMYRHLPWHLGRQIRLPRIRNLRKLARTKRDWFTLDDDELRKWASVLVEAPERSDLVSRRKQRGRGGDE